MRHHLAWPALALALISASAQAADTLTQHTDFGTPSSPLTISYGQSFTGLTGDTTFYQDFLFQVQSASFSNATLTMNLGSLLAISNLDVQLYRYADAQAPVYGAALDNPTVATLVAQGTGLNGAITQLDLSAGRYVLDISGVVTGSAGGSFAGVFNLTPTTQVTPVPEPTGLLLAAVGVLGLVRARRRGH